MSTVTAMFKHKRSIEYVVKRLRFRLKDVSYRGSGLLTWHPETHWHLDALVKRDKPKPDVEEFGKVRVLTDHDLASIHLGFEHGRWAYVPPAPLDEADLSIHDRLSINVSRVIFLAPPFEPGARGKDQLKLLLRFGSLPMFPDSVRRETFVADSRISTAHSKDGMRINNDDIAVRGLSKEPERFELTVLRRTNAERSNPIHWCQAACDALSILSCQTVQLLQAEVLRGRQSCEEIRASKTITELGIILSLFNQPYRITHDRFLRLTEFLAQPSRYATVCRNIFWQLVAAANQPTWQATEFLCATILEAALRSISSQPFVAKKGKDTFVAKHALEDFRQQYLSDEWKGPCAQVVRSFHILRDRTAHPDWLGESAGSYAQKPTPESLDHVVRLCRFYGFLILALSGEKGLQPRFPSPHVNWGPLYTFHRNQPKTAGDESATGEMKPLTPPEPDADREQYGG